MKLANGKAVGQDSLSAEVLKAGGWQCAYLIHSIIKLVAERMYVPIAWKGGRITALFKGKGDPGTCGNSRGLLILDHMAKILSDLLSIHVSPQYHMHMPESQHGCVRGKSTDLANHMIRAALEYASLARLSIFILFLDLEKAFDRVVREYVFGMPQGCQEHPRDYLSRLGLTPAALENALLYMRTHTGIFQQWGIDSGVIEIIKSMHSNSFYKYADLVL